MKTINEIQSEVQKIIYKHIHLEDRLAALKAIGYTVITYSWVKCGELGKLFYLNRKHIYRIQISESEIRGKYQIAWTLEIPAIEIGIKNHT